ncbi:MAG: SDR family oxidoreductase [Aureispira sp.]|nr:SDR family oxidoreductase [Aureispira sp.]
MKNLNKKTALITGASRGLGLALAHALADRGWNLIINGRNAQKLLLAYKELSTKTNVEAISGDVIDEIHLLQFPERIAPFGQLDLIINNASTLGASPQPKLLDYPIEAIHTIFHTNVIAPLSLLQKVKPFLSAEATIINISSDAAVEAYAGWGGYGSSKAALDHLTAILTQENPQWNIYAVDPGDMQTQMHQEAFPSENISDRPLPESTVPGFLHLIEQKLPSGRYSSPKLVEQITLV